MDLVAAQNTKVIVTMEHVDKVSKRTQLPSEETLATIDFSASCTRMAIPRLWTAVTSLSLAWDV